MKTEAFEVWKREARDYLSDRLGIEDLLAEDDPYDMVAFMKDAFEGARPQRGDQRGFWGRNTYRG